MKNLKLIAGVFLISLGLGLIHEGLPIIMIGLLFVFSDYVGYKNKEENKK